MRSVAAIRRCKAAISVLSVAFSFWSAEIVVGDVGDVDDWGPLFDGMRQNDSVSSSPIEQ
jgi:hypothetical protein